MDNMGDKLAEAGMTNYYGEWRDKYVLLKMVWY